MLEDEVLEQGELGKNGLNIEVVEESTHLTNLTKPGN